MNSAMNPITTHPATAAQAKAFTAPGSLSFPGGAGDLTPPSSEADKNSQQNGAPGQGQQVIGQVTPATPAATPGATQGVSGIVPTLQYVLPYPLICIREAYLACQEISLPRSTSIAVWT
jgi:transcription initiation factor TFIID TATA-box-binding protein